MAVQHKRKDLVQDLLLVGANPLLKNVRLVVGWFDRLPLEIALSHLRFWSTMFTQFTGKSAIDMALEVGQKEMASMLNQSAHSISFKGKMNIK